MDIDDTSLSTLIPPFGFSDLQGKPGSFGSFKPKKVLGTSLGLGAWLLSVSGRLAGLILGG